MGITGGNSDARASAILCLAYFTAYVDRANISIALASSMRSQLAITDVAAGWMMGSFYATYASVQIFSAAAALKVGVRAWLALLLFCTGITEMAMCTVGSFEELLGLRLLLGLVEGGLIPIAYHFILSGVRRRALGMSVFCAMAPLSAASAGLLSTAMIDGLDGFGGWAGWRWCFLGQGACTFCAGCILALMLPQLDCGNLETQGRGTPSCSTVLRTLGSESQSWWMVLLVFAGNIPLIALNSWMPEIASSHGFSAALYNAVVVLPYVCAAAALFLYGSWECTPEQGREVASHSVICGICSTMLASVFIFADLKVLFVFAICGANAFLFVFTPGLFGWAHHVWSDSQSTAAIGLAMLNTAVQVSNLLGPILIGYLRPLGDASALLAAVILPLFGALGFRFLFTSSLSSDNLSENGLAEKGDAQQPLVRLP